MTNSIKSKDNERIKHAKSLLKNKYRKEECKFVIEGLRIIKQSIECECDIDYILYSDDFAQKNIEFVEHITVNKIKSYLIDNNLVKELAETENAQGVFAIVNSTKYTLDKILKEEIEFVLILDRIQDPGNMGTLIRSADASGVCAIINLKGCVDIYNPKVIRSTMGSIFNTVIIEDEQNCISILKENGFTIVSSTLETNKYYNEIEYNGKIALVIGNEGNGIEPEILKNSDELVKIPIYGKAESLNAAIAGGILMYDIKNKLIKNNVE